MNEMKMKNENEMKEKMKKMRKMGALSATPIFAVDLCAPICSQFRCIPMCPQRHSLLTGDLCDLWEAELEQHLLLVVHHVHASPVDGDDDVVLRQVRS